MFLFSRSTICRCSKGVRKREGSFHLVGIRLGRKKQERKTQWDWNIPFTDSFSIYRERNSQYVEKSSPTAVLFALPQGIFLLGWKCFHIRSTTRRIGIMNTKSVTMMRTMIHWIISMILIFWISLSPSLFKKSIMKAVIRSTVAIANHGAVPFPFLCTQVMPEKNWITGSIHVLRIMLCFVHASISFKQVPIE